MAFSFTTGLISTEVKKTTTVNKGLMSRTMAVQVRYYSYHISLPSYPMRKVLTCNREHEASVMILTLKSTEK